MSITKTWTVAQMDVCPKLDGVMDVVLNVHWTLNGTDGTYTGNVYGSVGISLDEDAVFTSYADLTLDQVVGWVQAALGEDQIASYEANIAQQIANQINPPVITPALPWSA